jgi:hypothetical protein
MPRPEQTTRHKIFKWYLRNWNSKYSNDWKTFITEKGADFISYKKIPPTDSLLAMNLQHIFEQFHRHCPKCSNKDHIKNVLLFFDSHSSKPPKETSEEFTIVPFEYDESSNYVTLY